MTLTTHTGVKPSSLQVDTQPLGVPAEKFESDKDVEEDNTESVAVLDAARRKAGIKFRVWWWCADAAHASFCHILRVFDL